MSTTPFNDLPSLAAHFRQQLQSKKFILVYAYNGTGKTRLSTEFKNLGKNGEERDTLYFNAFTEDLFSWDNDLASVAQGWANNGVFNHNANATSQYSALGHADGFVGENIVAGVATPVLAVGLWAAEKPITTSRPIRARGFRRAGGSFRWPTSQHR